MSTVTIYHNPDCGTSRNTLALIRASSIEPTVIEYVKAPPERETLKALIARMGMRVRDVLRVKGTPYKELGLDAAHWSDDQLIDQMLAHPILINRPIVVSPLGVRLCRPSDMVIELLPQRPAGEICKEDGTTLLADTPIAGSDPDLALALHEAGLPTDDLTEPGRRFSPMPPCQVSAWASAASSTWAGTCWCAPGGSATSTPSRHRQRHARTVAAPRLR